MSIVILGGGTYSDVTPHLSLCTRAFGTTAKELYASFSFLQPAEKIHLVLTRMANSDSDLVSNSDVGFFVDTLLANPDVKVIIFNVAMCDFKGTVDNEEEYRRLSSEQQYKLTLIPDTEKVLAKIKKARPDIFVVGFKTTHRSTSAEQIQKAKLQILKHSVDLVLANDIGTRNNILVSSSEEISGNRNFLLGKIIHRSLLHVA